MNKDLENKMIAKAEKKWREFWQNKENRYPPSFAENRKAGISKHKTNRICLERDGDVLVILSYGDPYTPPGYDQWPTRNFYEDRVTLEDLKKIFPELESK